MLSKIEQFFEQIKKAKNPVIIFNKNWALDNVASAIALFLFLKRKGVEADVLAEKNTNDNFFNFLPFFSEIKNNFEDLRSFVISVKTENLKVDKIKYKATEDGLNFFVFAKEGVIKNQDISLKASEFKYDLIITIGASDLESLGSFYKEAKDFFYEKPIINLDISSANEEYGQINIVNLKSSSVAEILFKLFSEKDKNLVDANIATCLLAGIIGQTKSFKTSNVTPEALIISSELISLGAKKEEIVNSLYRNYNVDILKLWGKVLTNIRSGLDEKYIWSEIDDSNNFNSANLINIFEDLISSMPKAELAIIFLKKDDKKRALAYSVKNIDCLDIFKDFKPNGTNKFCEILIDKNIEVFNESVIEKIKKII